MRDVVYVTAGHWPGTFVIVEEHRPWGVIGYMPIPTEGCAQRAYVRLATDEFTKIGEIPDEDPSA